MNKLKIKGIWIPKEILLNNEISDKEKILLSIILYLSTELDYCFCSNRYLSKILGVTINRVSKLISSLKNKGYIEVILNYDEDKNYIKSRELKLTDKILKYINKDKCIKKANSNRANFEQRKYTKEEIEKLYITG